MENCKVLVIFDSDKGTTRQLAEAVRVGAAKVNGVIAEAIHCDDVELIDMLSADAFAFGTPNHFGSMSSKMKKFFRRLRPLWEQGALRGRPASVFTASGRYHGGAETALLTLMFPLFAHGMILIGVPAFPRECVSEGCYLGAKASIDHSKQEELDEDCVKSAEMLGERLSRTVLALKVGRKQVKEFIVDQKKTPSTRKKLSKKDFEKLVEDESVTSWECSNCGHVHEGDLPPGQCPICNLASDYFVAYSVDAWECTKCGFVVYSDKPENECPVCSAKPDAFVPYKG